MNAEVLAICIYVFSYCDAYTKPIDLYSCSMYATEVCDVVEKESKDDRQGVK